MNKQQVAVIGLGVTGLSCVEFLRAQGHHVTVFDTRACPPCMDELSHDVDLVLGLFDDTFCFSSRVTDGVFPSCL